MQFLEWKHHIEGLDHMSGFRGQEKDHAKHALLYLQEVLGEDFLRRCGADHPCVARHPLLRTLANFAPCSRRSIVRFAGELRALEGSQNFANVLARLHDVTQFEHDALLIKASSRLVAEGWRARFEPTMEVKDNQKQPDLRLQDPHSGETVFLEVTTQVASQAEREVTNTNSAVFATLFGTSYDLCLSGRWHKTPSKQSLAHIIERIQLAAVRVRDERTMIAIQVEGVLEMALCHRNDKERLLDPWSAEKGLSGCGFIGPVMSSNDTVRINSKIRKKQTQLPHENANALLVLATDAFFRAGGVRRVIREVEEGVSKYEHINLVILHGEYVGGAEIPFTRHFGEHLYSRRVVDGSAEVDLILLNRHSPRKVSNAALNSFRRSF